MENLLLRLLPTTSPIQSVFVNKTHENKDLKEETGRQELRSMARSSQRRPPPSATIARGCMYLVSFISLKGRQEKMNT